MVKYLHAYLPVSRSIGEDNLIALISGYAGVVGRWLNRFETPSDVEELWQLAENAHANCYPELEALLDDLTDDERGLAIRLSLLDNAGIEAWPKLREVLLNTSSVTDIDSLARRGLLENSNPPTYGHIKRVDVARVFLSQHYIYGVHEELRYLVAACADQVINIDADSRPFAEALFTIGELVRKGTVAEVLR